MEQTTAFWVSVVLGMVSGVLAILSLSRLKVFRSETASMYVGAGVAVLGLNLQQVLVNGAVIAHQTGAVISPGKMFLVTFAIFLIFAFLAWLSERGMGK